MASLLILTGCSAIAIIEYNNHKVTKEASQTSQVQAAVHNLELHDAVNAKAVSDLQSKLASSDTQFKTDQSALCQFIIAHTPKTVTVPSECTANPL